MQDFPWFKSYDPDMPHTLAPYLDKTMIDFVDESAKARPYRAMLFFQGAPMTYADFVRNSDALAAALVDLGIKKGDRVAMLLPNSPQTMLGFQGVWKAGAVACPVNPLYTERELEQALKNISTAAVIALNPFYEMVKKIQPASCKFVIATNIKEYLPPLLKTNFTLLKEKKEGHKITLKQGDYRYKYLLHKYKNTGRPKIEVKLSDPAVTLFNGGTAGTPGGVVGTHQALVMTALQIRAWLSSRLEEWDDRVALTMPLFNVNSCVGAMGIAAVNHSSCILIPDQHDLTDVVMSIKKYKPAFISDITDFYIGILDHPLVTSGKVSLKSLKLCIAGATPLMPETKQRFESMTGGRLIDSYAMTRCMQSSMLNPVKGVNKESSLELPNDIGEGKYN